LVDKKNKGLANLKGVTPLKTFHWIPASAGMTKRTQAIEIYGFTELLRDE
jgi:hypothetical protein